MKSGVWITLIGVVLGALAGWVYYTQWGCTSGCGITGDPWYSSLYGAAMGGLLVNTFKPSRKTTDQ